MRTLKFIVKGQIIERDPNCDFTNLIPGTNGYLRAEFSFSSEWDGCTKVASFWSSRNEEFAPQVLKDGKSCMIPKEASDKYGFRIGIVGKKRDTKLTTNKVTVKQNGGAA